MEHDDLKGPDFDKKFAKAMLEDHERDVAEVRKARDATSDDKLKSLLTAVLPTLEKQQETARKLTEKSGDEKTK